MKPGLGYNAWRYIYLCLLVLLAPTTGLSIILHPDGEPNLTTWTDRPVNAVVGRWSYNASFVVVSPKWILTTRHQNTNPATVNINGVTYNCIYNSRWVGGGDANNADIRLIRLKNTDGSDPDLADYAAPYTTTDEMQDPNIVIGGWGRLREALLQTKIGPNYYTYGYTWGTRTNTNQRWCTNIIDGNDVVTDTWTSDVITARFNDQGTTPPATQYEGTPAEYDSGGGWFIKDGADWKVAGLTRGVGYHGTWPDAVESWYRNPLNPNQAAPDYMDAVRISSYAAWINKIIIDDCPVGDLNSDCKVDMLDFAQLAGWWLRTNCVSGNSFCNGADFQLDNDVDMIDLAFFAQNWLVDKSL